MKYLVYSLFIIPFFFSCNDDDQSGSSIPDPIIEEPILFPLALGNYWVYEVAKVDALGNEELLPYNDTIRIVGASFINDETYYTIEDNNFGFGKVMRHVRDSSGFLINSRGNILLSTLDFDQVIYTYEAGPVRIEYTMQSEVQNVNVPFGAFDCLNFEGILSDVNDEENTPRTLFNLYSDEVGLVASNIFFFSNRESTWERRLIDFKLE